MSKCHGCHLLSLRRFLQEIGVGVLILFFLFCLAFPAAAREVAGVQVAETLTGGEGIQLRLNGAGIRYKFFFKIYVGALYLEHPSRDVKAVIGDNGSKRMVMHFLYDEVSREKLIAGWNDGFEKNITGERLKALKPRIDQFNSLFSTVREGDVIVLDYQPERGTEVIIRGEKKGLITGKDFNDALLLIWLGEEPVTEDLKEALLDYSGKN